MQIHSRFVRRLKILRNAASVSCWLLLFTAEFMENYSSKDECRWRRRGRTSMPALSMCGVTATFPGGSVHFMMLEGLISVRSWQSCRRKVWRCCRQSSYQSCCCTNVHHWWCFIVFTSSVQHFLCSLLEKKGCFLKSIYFFFQTKIKTRFNYDNCPAPLWKSLFLQDWTPQTLKIFL